MENSRELCGTPSSSPGEVLITARVEFVLTPVGEKVVLTTSVVVVRAPKTAGSMGCAFSTNGSSSFFYEVV